MMSFISNALKLLAKKRVFLFLRTGALVDRNTVLSNPSKTSLGNGTQVNSYCVLKAHGGGEIKIGRNVVIGEASVFHARGFIEIGDNTVIAPNVSILSDGHYYTDTSKTYSEQPIKAKGIKVGKNVWLAANATILDGVSIGDNSIVAAGSIVTKDVPANVLVMGVPAKVMKKIGK